MTVRTDIIDVNSALDFPKPLKNQKAFVTGANSGIGEACALAQELAPKKIRVNSIAPGAVKTPIDCAAWGTPAAEAELHKLIPKVRVGVPQELPAARFVWPPAASDYVTGTTLFVDGGMTLYPGFATGG